MQYEAYVNSRTAAAELTGDEIFIFLQDGVAVQGTLNEIAAYIGGGGGGGEWGDITGTITDQTDLVDYVSGQMRLTRTVTGADSIVQTDDNSLIIFNSGSPFNFTLDQLTANTKVSFLNIGAGAVTFLAGTGVTISGETTLAAAAGTSYPTAFVFFHTATTPRVVTGGTGGGGGGTVESVTGDFVDNTDPANPVIDLEYAALADYITGTDTAKLLNVAGFISFRQITRSAASVSSGTMTLDGQGKREIRFINSTAQSSAFAIAFSGTTLNDCMEWDLFQKITGSVAITFPSSCIAGYDQKIAGRWNESTKVFTVGGTGASSSWVRITFVRIDSSTIQISAIPDYLI